MKSNCFIAGVLVASLFIGGCGKGSDDESTSSDETISEIASGAMGGAANAAESGGALAWESGRASSRMDGLLAELSPFPRAAWAATACPKLNDGGTACSGSTITLTYSACTHGNASNANAPIWNGAQILTFAGGATCNTTPTANTSGTMTRTFSVGTTRTNAAGIVVHAETSESSGYEAAKTGGTTVAFGSGSRDITINGLHLYAQKTFTTKKGESKTVTVWDHTLSTDTAMHVTGTGASRQITAGATRTQHNLLLYTGVSTVTSTLTFSAGCCTPTGGSITTTLSGSRTGTETLAFSSTCGSATLTASDGAVSTISLRHCF